MNEWKRGTIIFEKSDKISMPLDESVSLEKARKLMKCPMWRTYLEQASGMKGQELFTAIEQAIMFGWMEFTPRAEK